MGNHTIPVLDGWDSHTEFLNYMELHAYNPSPLLSCEQLQKLYDLAGVAAPMSYLPELGGA